MKKTMILVALMLAISFSAMAGDLAPTRLDNMRSLGMGRAYTANGGDRIGIFFYNPAAIQNVDFGKLSIFNFSISLSRDWYDMFDELNDLVDKDLNFDIDKLDATDPTSQKNKDAWETLEQVRQTFNGLYDKNGSGYFQNLSNWTNDKSGIGFAFFVKAGVEIGFNKSTASEMGLTDAEINAIDLGAAVVNSDGLYTSGVGADISRDPKDNKYFKSTDVFPGLDLKNYVDVGVMATKGFSIELDKKMRGADRPASLDYGVTAKMIQRTSVIDKTINNFEGVSAKAADFVANENVDTKYDAVSETRIGFDIGAILHTKDDLNTRIGVSVIDFISSDFGDYGKPDAQVNIGLAFNPFKAIENPFLKDADVAVDIQDFSNSDKSFSQKLKIGIEGTTTNLLTWRVGYTDKNISTGVNVKLGKLFSLNMAVYSDIQNRFGKDFKTTNYAFQFGAMF